jgi:O-antigen ligase
MNSHSGTRIAQLARWLCLSLLLLVPWLLGGQILEVQLGALLLATLAFVISLIARQRSILFPLSLGMLFAGYILVQYANPVFTQEWQTGLRIWELRRVDYITWLPSSIRSDFSDASPLRFLIIFLTAGCCGLACYQNRREFGTKVLLPLLAVNTSLIALLGLIQKSLESRSILGLYAAADEGLGLFYGTFLYKNHAAAFLNLGMAVCLACFFAFKRNTNTRRSNPSWLFSLCAALLFIGVIFSKSRFGFLGSLGILGAFIPLALKQANNSGLSTKRVAMGFACIAIVIVGGGAFLLGMKGTRHLQTMNAEITEDFSYMQRKLAYQSELRMFAEKPIYGWGAGNFRHGFRQFQDMDTERGKVGNAYMERHELNFFWQHAHNDYLEWLIELGVVGTLILFSIPGYFFRIIFKSRRWKEPVPLMLLVGLGSTMVHALIDFPFRNPAVLMTWAVMLVVTARLCEPKKSEGNLGT